MMPIEEVVGRVRAEPAPVLIVDTCNFLDLLRTDNSRRVEVEELKAADLLRKLLARPIRAVHLLVPELVPREFSDNADTKVGRPFRTWLKNHDDHQQWLTDAARVTGVRIPPQEPVGPYDLFGHLRGFAQRLLSAATVLARDESCVQRAVQRVIDKRRPSHDNYIKDSMNLEQALEFCRQLLAAGPWVIPICFVSSNTSDFAEPKGTHLHTELTREFDLASMSYFPNLRAVQRLLPREESES